MFKDPPKDVPPEILFRQLTEVPRPKKKLDFKLMDIDLYVQSISGTEFYDSCSKQNNEIEYNLLSKCLILKNGKKAFNSPESIKNSILKSEYEELQIKTKKILAEISPTFYSSDNKSWVDKLKEGARHPSNYLLTFALGECFEMTVVYNKCFTKDKPEEWFNIPKKELIDCHWFAYMVARNICKDSIFKEEAKKVDDIEFSKSLKSMFNNKG